MIPLIKIMDTAIDTTSQVLRALALLSYLEQGDFPASHGSRLTFLNAEENLLEHLDAHHLPETDEAIKQELSDFYQRELQLLETAEQQAIQARVKKISYPDKKLSELTKEEVDALRFDLNMIYRGEQQISYLKRQLLTEDALTETITTLDEQQFPLLYDFLPLLNELRELRLSQVKQLSVVSLHH